MRGRRVVVILCLVLVAGLFFGEARAAATAEAGLAGHREAAARSKKKGKKKQVRRKKRKKRRGAKPASPAEDSAEAAARQHYQQGERLFAVGEYEDALREYSAGYKKKPLSGFLFNIAKCHWNIGDAARASSEWDKAVENYDRAIFFFEKYLGEAENIPQRASFEQVVADLKKSKAEAEQAAREAVEAERAKRVAAAMEARRRAAEAAARMAADERAQIEAARKLEEARLAALKQDTPVYKKWWFWTIVGVVVASGSGAAAMALTAGPSTPEGNIDPGIVDIRGTPWIR